MIVTSFVSFSLGQSLLVELHVLIGPHAQKFDAIYAMEPDVQTSEEMQKAKVRFIEDHSSRIADELLLDRDSVEAALGAYIDRHK